MKKTFLPVLSLALIVSACFKPEPLTDVESPNDEIHNIVNITVSTEKDISQEDPETKVTYDQALNKFSFEDGDYLQLLLGKGDGTTFSHKEIVLPMDSSKPGVFSMNGIDLEEYEYTDILGVVLVRDSSGDPLSRAHSDNKGTSFSLRMNVSNTDQVQTEAGVFSNDGRFPIYAYVPASYLHKDDDNNITIDKLSLRLACAIWEYHIYGAEYTDETILSVTINGNGTEATQYVTANPYFRTTSWGRGGYGQGYHYSKVSVAAPFNVAANLASSGTVYHAIYGNGTAIPLGEVVVETDKAVYIRDFASAPMARTQGSVTPININIGTSGSFTRHSKTIEYSIDGGNTWSEWTDELPDDVTTYTLLSLRQSYAALTADHLTAIKDWIKQQSNPVSLDLSGIKYTDTTFPDTFNGTSNGGINNTNGITVKAAGTKIKSIKFPSNVTAIAASAFNSCTALEAVDLTGIKSIGSNAFCNTALVTLDVPASVTSIGNLAFAYCWALTDVTYHPKTEVNTANCFIFGCRNNKATYANCPDKYQAENLIPLTFRFAKGARVLKYMFDTNHKLQTLIFEGDPNENGVGADAWLIRCRFLKTIDCSALTKVMAFTKTNASGIGEQIEDGTGSIILPTGLATTGWGLWNTLDSGAKYSITSAE